MGRIKYFAYGSNMSEKRMIDRGLTPSGKQIGILNNYKFLINKKSFKNPDKGFANIQISDGDVVEGILYEVSESDIKKLDRFEGYPKHYSRKTLMIQTQNKEFVSAIVYIAQPNWTSQKELNATEEYKNFILEGKNFISDNYYKFLNESIKI